MVDEWLVLVECSLLVRNSAFNSLAHIVQSCLSLCKMKRVESTNVHELVFECALPTKGCLRMSGKHFTTK